VITQMQDNTFTEKFRITMFFTTSIASGKLERTEPESSDNCTRWVSDRWNVIASDCSSSTSKEQQAYNTYKQSMA
jgi:hypothetical protein